MALMLLADPSAAKGAVLKGVQSGTATSTGNGTVTVNITSVDTSKAFLIFQTRHSSNRPGGFMLRGRIASSTTLEFTRVTPESSTINIQWYVVEYLSGVKVQHGTVSQGTQATINVPITAVSAISQAFILWSKTPHPSDTVWSGDDPLTAELTTTTNLQFKIGQVISDQHEIAWQVVEFTDAADILVQKGTTSLTGSNLSTDVTLPTGVDINRTFLLVGYRSTGTGADIGRRMMRAQLINSTTLRLDRAVGHSSDPLSEIIWHAIELKDGSTTQRGTANLASGAASAAVSISPIDPTRSVAFSAVQPVGGQNLGMSSYVGDDILGVGSATMELTSNTLTLRRNSTVAATDIGYFVVQFPSPLTPANVPYAHDFESAMGAEWSDTTRTSNGTYTNFAGRYHNSSLKLALNTTPGEVYRLLFDFYAVDSWDGNESGNGPDAFVISVNGSTVFNHTFDHQWPGDGMSYPYPYDQKGHYGFNGSFEDGIYRKVEVVFTAPSSVSTISFTGQLTGGGGISDESWGIDNVAVGTARFKDVSSTKGFNVQTSSAETYGTSMHWGDLDNDGDLDCIATGNTAKLLLNNNAGQSFTSSTFGGADVRRAGALVDLDHDGDLDFWAAAINGYDAERFFQNSGSASFSDQGNLGLSGPSNNENVAAADVNGDGWCDIVMLSGNNGNWIGHHQGGGTPALTQTKSSSYGLNDSGDYGNGEYSSTGDVNNDNLPDFFYHYDSGKLFVSDGDGTYTENTHGISVVANGVDKFGSAWGDYDNDGDLDLFAARVTETCTGYLWRNDRDWAGATGSFTNVTTAAGFNLNTSVNYSPDLPGTRSVAWGDYDNDGDLDVLLAGANGNNYLYQNQGNGTFQRSPEGISLSGAFVDAAFVDFDNDGDLDISLTRFSGSTVLFENRTNGSSYLKVRVIGAGAGKTTKSANGTRIELWDEDETTFVARRDLGVARGFGGTEPLWAHIGGINPGQTYVLKVFFNSGIVSTPVVPNAVSTTIGSQTIPQMITITEKSGVKIIKWKEVLSTSVSP